MVPRGIEHLDGEWLVLMWYAATELLDVEWLFWCGVLPLMFVSSGCLWNRASKWGMAGFDVVCCHWCASRLGARRIERLDVEWLFWCGVLPLMFVSSGCLWNRASRLGMAGYPALWCQWYADVDRGCSQRIQTRNVGLECFSIPRAWIHATGKRSVYLGIRFQNVL